MLYSLSTIHAHNGSFANCCVFCFLNTWVLASNMHAHNGSFADFDDVCSAFGASCAVVFRLNFCRGGAKSVPR